MHSVREALDDSLIVLAREMGLTVREEPHSIDQWQLDAKCGRRREAFACGTAAVVTPIGKVKRQCHEFTIGDGDGDGDAGEATGRLKAALLEIQKGRAADRHGCLDRLYRGADARSVQSRSPLSERARPSASLAWA